MSNNVERMSQIDHIVCCETLRELRESKGLTQVALGWMAAVNSSHISSFECGHKYPYPKARRLLAQALAVTPEELFPEYQETPCNSLDLHWPEG